MANIVVLQHGPRQTPGRLGMTLRDHGFLLDIRRPDLSPDDGGTPIPEDLDNVHGVVSLGGLQNTSEPHPWIAREIDFLRAAHDAQLPVIGICLGAQLIAKALGGDVGPMDTPEAGFCPIDIQFVGQTHPILAGLPWRHMQFQSHAHEVKGPPPGATLLASSDACQVQAFAAGVRTFGFQFHPELDRPGIDSMVKAQTNLLALVDLEPDAVNQQADLHYENYARAGDRLCLNLKTFVFAPTELLRA